MCYNVGEKLETDESRQQKESEPVTCVPSGNGRDDTFHQNGRLRFNSLAKTGGVLVCKQSRTSYPGGDAQLIADLRDAKDEAAVYLLKWAVMPEANKKCNWKKVEDATSSCEELLSDVYDEIFHRGKLSLFRGDSSFISWVRIYTRKFISEKIGKVQEVVSDSESESVMRYEGASQEVLDDLRQAGECLSELWKETPMRGYVHLMKVKFGLSSQEIADLCGISTSNVDQYACRAMANMIDKQKKYMGRP